MRILILCMALIFSVQATAQEAADAPAPRNVGEVTNLPIPRFVSVRSDRVFARTGPGTRYPIKWVYERKDLPVEIVQEFDTWRKIRDIDGEDGWVHQSLLSGRRFAFMSADQGLPMYRRPQEDSRSVAIVQPKAILEVDSCKNKWCNVKAMGLSGWIQSENLWGVYEGEQFE